jgi:hypothetical protein
MSGICSLVGCEPGPVDGTGVDVEVTGGRAIFFGVAVLIFNSKRLADSPAVVTAVATTVATTVAVGLVCLAVGVAVASGKVVDVASSGVGDNGVNVAADRVG